MRSNLNLYKLNKLNTPSTRPFRPYPQILAYNHLDYGTITMELSHSLDNEDTHTPASSTAVGARVWYGLYWRKMAVVQASEAA